MKRAAVILSAIAFVSACRPEGVTVLSDSELPVDVYGSPQPTPEVSPEQLPARGTVYLVRQGRLVDQQVTLQPGGESLQEALMVALLGASSPPQPRRGPRSEIPELTRLLDIEVDGTVATVDLSPEFSQGPAESLTLRLNSGDRSSR
ncbi:MAG TPA: GerMN domain-containing protein [Actinomycetota bacterium]|nr:GerMN domain-containing protein [Actinomycetota bacterium]